MWCCQCPLVWLSETLRYSQSQRERERERELPANLSVLVANSLASTALQLYSSPALHITSLPHKPLTKVIRSRITQICLKYFATKLAREKHKDRDF